jgi:DUF1680 family protein/lysophospholipase L1-like esterase
MRPATRTQKTPLREFPVSHQRRPVAEACGLMLAALLPGAALGQAVTVPPVSVEKRPATRRTEPGDGHWPETLQVGDVLQPSAAGGVQLGGWIGQAIDASMQRRVLAQDVARLVVPFRERTEEHGGHWRCEYWGKWFTSAALAAAYAPTPEAQKKVSEGVAALLETQTPDGYIGTYRDDKRLEAWDVWGRKYVLLGLLADHDLTGSEASLAAARRQADLLLAEAEMGRIKLVDLGLEVVGGLPPSSILEPLALLYQRTGDRRYLDYCRNIVADWSQPGTFSPTGPRLLESAAAGVPPARIGSRKAYEMMSCFEGICELYRITGERQYLDAALAFARSVESHEIMVHGSGSNQELWCGGARLQTGILEQPVETCVTVTWMKLCDQLLRLTGDPAWADMLEVSLYNALLGAMTPDGEWWAYFSPLVGQRVPSHYQHADMELSCCVANGPRGLLLTPRWAVMRHEEGPVVNLYEQGSVETTLRDGTVVTLTQETTYPEGDVVSLTVTPEEPRRFVLRLRIPAWSRETRLTVAGESVAVEPGTYACIERLWSAHDRVELRLDMRGRAVPAPSGAPEFALMRGPVVLALDDRLVEPRDIAAWLGVNPADPAALEPAAPATGVRLAFKVPFDVRPKHYFEHHQISLPMCDYASAGNGWSGGNLFRVWLPQPLFLRDAYPAGTWRLTCPDIHDDACPVIPEATSVVPWAAGAGVVDRVTLRATGDWEIQVNVEVAGRRIQALLPVPRPEPMTTTAEPLDGLEVWRDQPGWARPKIPGLVDGIHCARFLLDPDSLVVRAGPDSTSMTFERGRDFDADAEWGTIGRLPDGRIAAGQGVYLDYRAARRRIDSVVLTPDGRLELRAGAPHVATPRPPELATDELRVANVWLPENLPRLGRGNLFPIEETSFPEPVSPATAPAEALLPQTMAKLRGGGPLRILAWGDSVTEGYLGDDQWQRQFVRRLEQRFPQATIELVTVGWGAHTSNDFLAAPPGHVRNFAETVLSSRPDLVISEFVNDSPLDPELVRRNYEQVLADFRRIGTEWILLTPHPSIFTNPPQERDIDDDPRPYVQLIRDFAAEHGLPVADAAARYGRLWRQGIPYTTLMVNAANHPDARGMAIFADSLMALFP